MFPGQCLVVNVTWGKIKDWETYQWQKKNITVYSLINDTRTHCRLEYCQSLNWQGNPDLSGIGVLSGYIIQVILAMVFLVAYGSRDVANMNWERRWKGIPIPKLPNAHVTPRKRFNQSLDVFWTSSLYYGFCLLITSVSIAIITDNSEHTVHFSFLGSLFSLSVLGTLWPWYHNQAKHPHLALTAFCLLYTLLLILAIYAVARGFNWNTTFELSCFYKLPTRGDVLRLMSVLLSSAIFIFPFVVRFWFSKVVRKRQRPGFSQTARSIFGLVSFVLLWVSLGVLIRLRAEMSKYSGKSYAENQWGFGQILAVVAWVPTFVEFARVWKWESTKTHIAPKIRASLQLQPTVYPPGVASSTDENRDATEPTRGATEARRVNPNNHGS
ncbi:hypothetical protein V8F20_006239 [Naviculisporaceae sp. PSN 640]